MRIVFFLLTIIFTVLCYSDDKSYKFVYKDVFACSKKKFEYTSELTTDESQTTYIIHSSKFDENYVVFHHGSEHSSFRKHNLTHLYVQSGGTRWLEIDQISKGVIKFTLYLLKDDITYTTTLIFDENSLSAVKKSSWEDTSTLLICWDMIGKN